MIRLYAHAWRGEAVDFPKNKKVELKFINHKPSSGLSQSPSDVSSTST